MPWNISGNISFARMIKIGKTFNRPGETNEDSINCGIVFPKPVGKADTTCRDSSTSVIAVKMSTLTEII